MKEFITENIKSISIGIVSSVLFLYFFQPILDFIGSNILKVFSLISLKYSDDFYARISHLELMDFSFYWVSIIFLTVGFTAGITSIKGFIGLFKNNQESEVEKKQKNNINASKFAFYSINLIVCFITILFISTRFYQLNLITSFNHHMRIIAPYMSEQEEESIISNWSLMKSHKDYEKIYKSLKNTAHKNNIQLPENKIYSLTTF